MKLLLAIVISGIVLLTGVGVVFVKLRGVFVTVTPTATARVEKVSSGELIETVSAPGEVQPRTKVSISAKVAAPIIELPFKEGDRVTRGKPLVKLDARDLEAALVSAKARLAAQEAQIEVSMQRISASNATIDSMRANLRDARNDLDRQKHLLETKDVSPSVVDTALSKFDSMTAQLKSSEFSKQADEANLKVERAQRDAALADVSKAVDELSYTTILAPIDGVVTRRKAEVGEMVVPGIQGSPGTTIMEVADLSQMLMVARIDESSITQVQPGQRALIRLQAFPDKVFEGTVEWVANTRADPASGGAAAAAASADGSRYFECKICLLAKGEEVKSGLSADADIEVHRHTGLKVPSQAVLGRPTDGLPAALRNRPEVDQAKTITTVVYRLINGKAVVTPVTVGASDETHTLIKSGLTAADQVITGPFKTLEALADGQVVNAEMVPVKNVAPSPATTMSAR